MALTLWAHHALAILLSGVTAAVCVVGLFALFRRVRSIQEIVLPGAREISHHRKNLASCPPDIHAALILGLCVRNGLTAVAIAIMFAATVAAAVFIL